MTVSIHASAHASESPHRRSAELAVFPAHVEMSRCAVCRWARRGWDGRRWCEDAATGFTVRRTKNSEGDCAQYQPSPLTALLRRVGLRRAVLRRASP
jgi:hypothetical protein